MDEQDELPPPPPPPPPHPPPEKRPSPEPDTTVAHAIFAGRNSLRMSQDRSLMCSSGK